MAERLGKAVHVSCLILIFAPASARADVVPWDEGECSGTHRQGDLCRAENDRGPPAYVDGTCQPSKCLQVDWDRYKGEPPADRPTKKVPCLKCVPKPGKGTACSIARDTSDNPRSVVWAIFSGLTLLLLARRRRPLSNRALQRTPLARRR
jgi:hypothetical protein